MKFLLIFLLFATSALAQTQNTEFVDYLLQLQYTTQSYYDSMMYTFRASRQSLSRQLKEMNTAGVTEITEGLRSIIIIRDSSQEIIDEADRNQNCAQTAIATWERGLDTAGTTIASCAEASIGPVNNATENFTAFLAEQSRVVFPAQNLVLLAFTEVNPILNQSGITQFVSTQVNNIYTQFNSEIFPSLFGLLNVLAELGRTVPGEIRHCTDAAVSRLADEAQVLRNTLEFC